MRAVVVALFLLAVVRSAAAAETRSDDKVVAGSLVIDLYTMGPGDDVFETFGHAALCVTSENHPKGVCYNYGVTDFSDPVQLTRDFLRGRALFWVSRSSLPRMLESYLAEDRAVYRQRIPLPEATAAALAARLEDDLLPENRSYFYHHYNDNCTTRLRDHIDRATGGKLARGTQVADGPSYRELSRRGFPGNVVMLAITDLILGEPADRPTSAWQAMFLPDVLRAEVAAQLGAVPEVLTTRHGPVATGSLVLGQLAMAGLAVVLALLALPALGRRRWLRRLALAVDGLVLGVLGLAFWALAFLSAMPELQKNDLILVFWPTDLALVFLGGRALLTYLFARLALIGLLLVGSATSFLPQPLSMPIFITAAPLVVFALSTRRPRPRDEA